LGEGRTDKELAILMPDVIVIGGGHNGLVAAARVAPPRRWDFKRTIDRSSAPL
jgi:ribulose 1,5-bisphosphate synthetase/thiazole synthase